MKNIVITGASSGIGLATAQVFLKIGCRVFGSVRSEKDAARLKSELGDHFEPLIFDVTNSADVLAAAEKVKQIVGKNGVAILVNNAGIAVSGPLQHLDIQELTQQLDINVLGVHRVTQAFLPLLGATRDPSVPKGKIINISSVNGFLSTPFMGAYCASKAALEAMSDILRRELTAFGVQVVVVQPGPIKTPIWEKARQNINLYPETEYANALKMSAARINATEASAIAVEKVGDLIFRISEMRRPKTRYLITPNRFLIQIVRRLPTKWVDFLLTASLKK